MGDVEWYLEVESTRSGPYKANQVVDMFERGMLPAQTKCTSDKIPGEYVMITDLVEAFYELQSTQPNPNGSTKPKLATENTKPIESGFPPGFQPPAMPVDQIEASKFITLPAKEANPSQDGGESLLSLLRSQRERRVQAQIPSGQAKILSEDGEENVVLGTLSRPQRLLTPQILSLLSFLAIGFVSYQAFKYLKERQSENASSNVEPSNKGNPSLQTQNLSPNSVNSPNQPQNTPTFNPPQSGLPPLNSNLNLPADPRSGLQENHPSPTSSESTQNPDANPVNPNSDVSQDPNAGVQGYNPDGTPIQTKAAHSPNGEESRNNPELQQNLEQNSDPDPTAGTEPMD